MEKITSRNNPKIVAACSLKNKPSSQFLVEGFHNIEMAFKAGLLKTVFSTKEINYKNVTSYVVTSEVLDKLATTKTPEGIVGICDKLTQNDISDSKVIYLDNIQDPGNIGTILRTALSFGFKDIILSKGCASIFNPKTVLASQGAIFFLNIIDGNINSLKSLQLNGYKIVSSCLKDSIPFSNFKINDKYVVVFGNEGRGISEEILSISDYKIRIEMNGIDSLNVGVAAGIILYNLSK